MIKNIIKILEPFNQIYNLAISRGFLNNLMIIFSDYNLFNIILNLQIPEQKMYLNSLHKNEFKKFTDEEQIISQILRFLRNMNIISYSTNQWTLNSLYLNEIDLNQIDSELFTILYNISKNSNKILYLIVNSIYHKQNKNEKISYKNEFNGLPLLSIKEYNSLLLFLIYFQIIEPISPFNKMNQNTLFKVKKRIKFLDQNINFVEEDDYIIINTREKREFLPNLEDSAKKEVFPLLKIEEIKKFQKTNYNLKRVHRKNLVKTYERKELIVDFLKKIYRFECQICKLNNPKIPVIMRKNKEPYIEVHHIIPLSLYDDYKKWNKRMEDELINRNIEKDLDIIQNMVVVCPYHHKLLHHSIYEYRFHQIQKKYYFISKYDPKEKLEVYYLNNHYSKNIELNNII